MSFAERRWGRPAGWHSGGSRGRRLANDRRRRFVLESLEGRLAPATGVTAPAHVLIGPALPAGTLPTTTTVNQNITTSVSGQPVLLTSTVKPTSGTGIPTGSVQFFNGTTLLGTVVLDGTGSAALSVSTLPLGMSSITSHYEGDANYAVSVSTAITHTVTIAATTTSLTASPTSTSIGLPVTLTATVSVTSPGTGSPTGSVEFFNGTHSLGTGTVTNGIAVLATTSLPIGTNTLTATYKGSTNLAGSSSGPVSVTVAATPTSTTITTPGSNSVFGQPVTFTATVSPGGSGTGTPSGTVQFLNGSTVLGTETLAAGKTTFTTSALPVGSNSVSAKYLGDTTFAASTSPAVTQTVGKEQTLTTVTTVPVPSAIGQAVKITANVSVTPPSTGTPTGNVVFYAGSTLLGTSALSNGVATFTTSTLPVGTSQILAVYQGNANTNGSTSVGVNQVVGNPNQLYLNQIYLDLLNRPIDTASLTKWSAALAAGRSRLSIVNAIEHSTEARKYEVQVVYQAYLQRPATDLEVTQTINIARSFGNDLRIPVLTSQNYIKSRGIGTADGLVIAVGNDVMGQQVNNPAYNAFVGQLNAGAPALNVVKQILASNPAHVAFVQGNFQKYLLRLPNAQELRNYVGQLNRGVSTREVVNEILASPEYYKLVTTVH